VTVFWLPSSALLDACVVNARASMWCSVKLRTACFRTTTILRTCAVCRPVCAGVTVRYLSQSRPAQIGSVDLTVTDDQLLKDCRVLTARSTGPGGMLFPRICVLCCGRTVLTCQMLCCWNILLRSTCEHNRECRAHCPRRNGSCWILTVSSLSAQKQKGGVDSTAAKFGAVHTAIGGSRKPRVEGRAEHNTIA